MKRILAINPGSTSTKIAWYEDQKQVFSQGIDHPAEELEKFAHVQDQFAMRKTAIEALLEGQGLDYHDLDGLVGRGGLLPPVSSGAYRVNEQMVDRLKTRPLVEHASNLGAIIAFAFAEELDVPAYIYDSVAVDEMIAIAKISGMPEIERQSFSHALNARAMAMKTARELGRSYEEMNLIVAHLGGGISVTAHQKGRMVDLVSDDEGSFSPERVGGLPSRALMKLCYSGKYDQGTMKKKLQGKGGFSAYLGTLDAREVETLILRGDAKAQLIYEAMAYQIAKAIAQLSVTFKGELDGIVITGGIAYSKMMTDWIRDRVSFLAPVYIQPGEYELESLAFGALRVLEGKEEAKEYKED